VAQSEAGRGFRISVNCVSMLSHPFFRVCTLYTYPPDLWCVLGTLTKNVEKVIDFLITLYNPVVARVSGD